MGNLKRCGYRSCEKTFESPTPAGVDKQYCCRHHKERANYNRRDYHSPSNLRDRHIEKAANKLERGEKIYEAGRHHKGMRLIKERLGNPCPEGKELSLINYWGPDSYWGYDHSKGKDKPYRLSINHNDYVWETHEENLARIAKKA